MQGDVNPQRHAAKTLNPLMREFCAQADIHKIII